MLRRCSVLVACASLVVGVAGGVVRADQFDAAGSKAETPTPAAETNGLEPVPDEGGPSRMVMRVAVRKINYVDRVVNGSVVKTPVVAIAYEDQSVPLPTSDAEIQKLREELRTLRQRKIDALDVPALVRELHQEREEARADAAWKKLQRIRKELAELESEHPGTAAAGVARTVQETIPGEAPSLMFPAGGVFPQGVAFPLNAAGGFSQAIGVPTYAAQPLSPVSAFGTSGSPSNGLTPVYEPTPTSPAFPTPINDPPQTKKPTPRL